MALFLSTFNNKIDSKGRVSVPSQFRAALSGNNFAGVVVYESFTNKCIEGCDLSRIANLSESIDNLDPFSEIRDAFATTILGSAVQLPFDGDGRIILPAKLIKLAQIDKKAIFVGKGKTFEIWQEDNFEIHSRQARQAAKEQRNLLKILKNEKSND